jgi:hypothetical protein
MYEISEQLLSTSFVTSFEEEKSLYEPSNTHFISFAIIE